MRTTFGSGIDGDSTPTYARAMETTHTVASVKEYLLRLPEEKRETVEEVRRVMLENLNPGFEEGIQYGMIGYYVPHSIFPRGYHAKPSEPLPFAHIGVQKNHIAVYLMGLYADPAREKAFRDKWAKTGKKLDMGKSCIRFKKLEDLALDVLGRAIRDISVADYVGHYERTLDQNKTTPKKTSKPSAKASTKRPRAKKAAAKPTR